MTNENTVRLQSGFIGYDRLPRRTETDPTIVLTEVPEGTELAYQYEGPMNAPDEVAAADAMLDRMTEHV